MCGVSYRRDREFWSQAAAEGSFFYFHRPPTGSDQPIFGLISKQTPSGHAELLPYLLRNKRRFSLYFEFAQITAWPRTAAPCLLIRTTARISKPSNWIERERCWEGFLTGLPTTSERRREQNWRADFRHASAARASRAAVGDQPGVVTTPRGRVRIYSFRAANRAWGHRQNFFARPNVSFSIMGNYRPKRSY